MRGMIIGSFISALLLFGQSCAEKDRHADDKLLAFQVEKEAYQQKMQKQLYEINNHIAALKNAVEDSGMEFNTNLNLQIARLEQRKEAVKVKLSELRVVEYEDWQKFRAELDRLILYLEQSLDEPYVSLK